MFRNNNNNNHYKRNDICIVRIKCYMDAIRVGPKKSINYF